MHKPETTGRMLKWAIEFGQFNLYYKLRVVIKGQALADFILEFPSEAVNEGIMVSVESSTSPLRGVHQQQEYTLEPWWTLHVDGALNNEGVCAGIILVTPEGHNECYSLCMEGN